MQPLNTKDRTLLLTKLGVKNAQGLNAGRQRHLGNKVNKKTNTPALGKKPKPNNRLAIAVRCITTGEIFPSQIAAATAHHLRPPHLSSHLKGQGQTCGGKKYEYVTYPNGAPVERPKKNTSKRSIRCITTGEVFGSLSSAAFCHDISINGLSLHLRGIQSHVGGKKYEYITNNTPEYHTVTT